MTQQKALVLIDLQNEFFSPKGNFTGYLTGPKDSQKVLVKNLQALIPRFRASGGHIIWVQAVYENRTEEPAGMKDNPKVGAIGSSEYLTNATHVYHIPCCEVNTFGAEIDPECWALSKPEDTVINKGYYSAFTENPKFLELLKAKGVTDAYFCGLATNTCVLATILDAIKVENLKVHAVPDCMGWRRYNAHEEAIARMKELAPLTMVNSTQILQQLLPEFHVDLSVDAPEPIQQFLDHLSSINVDLEEDFVNVLKSEI